MTCLLALMGWKLKVKFYFGMIQTPVPTPRTKSGQDISNGQLLKKLFVLKYFFSFLSCSKHVNKNTKRKKINSTETQTQRRILKCILCWRMDLALENVSMKWKGLQQGDNTKYFKTNKSQNTKHLDTSHNKFRLKSRVNKHESITLTWVELTKGNILEYRKIFTKHTRCLQT